MGKEYKPDIFLTLHSGIYGLFYPYASKLEDAKRNIVNMKGVLKEIQKNYCPWCYLGTPGQYLGYISHGNCLDYMYEKLNTKYSFAWEIYTNEVDYKDYVEFIGNEYILKKKSNTNLDDFLLNDYDSDYNLNFNTSFIQLESKSFLKSNNLFNKSENLKCLNMFNPVNEKDFNFSIENWMKSIIYLLKKIEEMEKK